MSNTPIGRVKYKGKDGVSYGVVTFWRGDRGGISVSMDKPTEKFPTINPLAALKRWASGDGFLDYWPADTGGSRSQGGQRTQGTGARREPDGQPDYGPDSFGDDDIPF